MEISLIDLLPIDKKTLLPKECNILFYSGISENEIFLGHEFNSLYNYDYPERKIQGKFKIVYIGLLGKPSESIPIGYNALLGIETDINVNHIKNITKLDSKGNITSICKLSSDNK